MNVLMISPGYPGEMPHFTAGLAAAGARVIGLGDQPREMLPEKARQAVTAQQGLSALVETKRLHGPVEARR